MKTVLTKVNFVEKSRRIEMLYRLVWAIIAGLVLYVFALVALIVLVVQFFYILIYARRHKGLFDFLKAVYVQTFRLNSYLAFLTDERPPLVPQMDV